MTQFAGRATRNISQDHSNPGKCWPDSQGYCPCPLETAPVDTAELICSDVGGDRHMPVIDLDLPCRLLPSGTPGHHHLYIDQAVTFEQYVAILVTMADAGLVQWGFVNTTRERGFGAVRHPDRPKAQTQ